MDIDLFNHSDPPEPDLVEYQEGRRFMEMLHFEQAIEHFNKSLEYKVHYKTLQLLGECLLKVNRENDALIPLAASVGLHPHFRQKWLLADALYRTNRIYDAYRVAILGLSEVPNYRNLKALLVKIEKEMVLQDISPPANS